MSCDTGPRLGEVWLQWLVKNGGVGPSTTPAPPWGVQFFYRMFGQETIVGSKCLFCDTESRKEVGWKKEETRVSKGL